MVAVLFLILISLASFGSDLNCQPQSILTSSHSENFQQVINATRPKCQMRDIIASHPNLFSETQSLISMPSGGGMMNPLFKTTEDTRELKKKLLETVKPRPQESINQAVSEVKDLLLSEVTQGRPFSELSADQKIMVNRLNTIKVKMGDCLKPEAYYTMTSHEVTFCSNASKTPKLALVQLIAHELGHVLDPCSLSSQMFKCDGEIQDPDNLRVATGRMFNGSAARGRPEIKEKLQNFLALNKVEVTDSGVPVERNPTLKTLQCLAQNYRGYQDPPVQGDGVCDGTGFTEGGAQVWSSRITNSYLKLNPENNFVEALGMMANSLPAYKSDKPSGKELDFNTLFLTQPEIQKMFNCEPVEEKNCSN